MLYFFKCKYFNFKYFNFFTLQVNYVYNMKKIYIHLKKLHLKVLKHF